MPLPPATGMAAACTAMPLSVMIRRCHECLVTDPPPPAACGGASRPGVERQAAGLPTAGVRGLCVSLD